MQPAEMQAARLREAVAAQSFADAGALLGAYGAAVEAELAELAPAARQARLQAARAFLAELRRMALAQRAHLASQYAGLGRRSPYLKASPPRRTFQVEG